MFKKLFSQKLGFKIALASVVIGLIGLVFSSYQIYAANISAGVLNISFDGDQLFSESNLAPGDEVVKDLTVTNTGTLPHSFSIAANGVSGALADVLQIEPRDGALVFWNETLANLGSLPNGSKVIIPSIPAGESRTIQIAAMLPASVGNDYQGESTSSFSFVMGNESTDQPEPSSNPSPPISFATSDPGPSIGTTTGLAVALGGDGEDVDDPSDTTFAGESSEEKTAEETKGATTIAKDLCFWWIVMLIILIAFLLIYHRYIREERPAFWWLWPIVMAAVLSFIQLFFDRHYQPTIFCRWFWALEAGILVIYYIYENYSETKKEGK
jgi:hypothetical protein